MRIIKTVNKAVEETDNIFCNKCGKSCYSEVAYGGLIGAKVKGGYCSKFIGDGDNYQFDICEKCFKEYADTFVIPAKVGNFYFPEEAEQAQKDVQASLNQLKNALQETAETIKDRLGINEGFVKFDDSLENNKEKVKQIVMGWLEKDKK